MQGILYYSSHFDTDKHGRSDHLIDITTQFNFDFKLIILQHVYIAWFLQYWKESLAIHLETPELFKYKELIWISH